MSTTQNQPTSEADIVARRKEIIRRRPKIGRWLGRIALVGYLFALWWYRDWIRLNWPDVDDVVWNFDSRAAIWESLKQFNIAAAAEALQFFGIGFLVVASAGRPTTDRSSFRRKFVLLALGLGLTTVVRGANVGGMPTQHQLWIPVIGCLFGMVIGAACVRGKKGIARLTAWSLVHLLLFVSFVTIVGYLATDAEPLDLETVSVSAADKRQIVERIRNAVKNGAAEQAAELRELRLSEPEVKMLSAWGLEAAGAQPRLDLRLEPETITLQTSQELNLPWIGRRYLNGQLTAEVHVAGGEPTLNVEELRLGRLGCPQFLCRYLSKGILSSLSWDEDVRTIVESIDELQVDEAEVILAGNRTAIREKVLPSIQSKLGLSQELIAATREQLNHLVAEADNYPRGDGRFVAIATTAFDFAQQRSAEHDPVIENQAAVLALGILLGHHRVADLSGSRDAIQHWEAARQRIGRVTIRGRGDWTQHFCVSAALVVLSDTTTSDLVGVLKEEIDSGGGSGFSFGDLLADRAGTLFAEAATRNERAARTLQERFAGGVTIDDLFPPAADLPEGIQDAELQSKFDGIEGRRYRQIKQEIERRLRECYLLQP